jgi:hypothetical protein
MPATRAIHAAQAAIHARKAGNSSKIAPSSHFVSQPFTTCFPNRHKIFKSVFYHKDARRTAEPPIASFSCFSTSFLLFSLQKTTAAERGRCFLCASLLFFVLFQL